MNKLETELLIEMLDIMINIKLYNFQGDVLLKKLNCGENLPNLWSFKYV